ncbi:MAG: YqaA family protein, partial [Pyrinomonadaceae bacterium]
SMIFIGALDSSLLSLPEINDYLVVMRCYSDPKSVFYFPLFAAAGSVIGSFFLYTIMRRGGRALILKWFSVQHLERVEAAYARFGLLTIAIPAILPPPLPFKIFVATAGALKYPRLRFILTIMIARSFRYFIEGALAVRYGALVLRFIEVNGLKMLIGVGALCLTGLVSYLLWDRYSKRVRKTDAPLIRKAPELTKTHD